ncbi:MAG: hypothetical protein ACEQSA_00480 [Weeksellaceae bacterium]
MFKHLNVLKDQTGQTMITLLVFMVVAISVTSTAVVVTINNSQGSSDVSRGIEANQIAESGAENALFRLLRDPTYAGESLAVGNGTATVTVTGTDPKTITSVGRVVNTVKTIQVIITYTNNIMTISSWQELH